MQLLSYTDLTLIWLWLKKDYIVYLIRLQKYIFWGYMRDQIVQYEDFVLLAERKPVWRLFTLLHKSPVCVSCPRTEQWLGCWTTCFSINAKVSHWSAAVFNLPVKEHSQNAATRNTIQPLRLHIWINVEVVSGSVFDVKHFPNQTCKSKRC